MIIERNDKEVILRLPLDIGTHNLDNIARYLKYVEITSGSKSDEDSTNEIADESKKRWWNENKHKYI